MTPGERVKGFIERIGPLKLLPVRCNYCDRLPTEHTETCPETAIRRLTADVTSAREALIDKGKQYAQAQAKCAAMGDAIDAALTDFERINSVTGPENLWRGHPFTITPKILREAREDNPGQALLKYVKALERARDAAKVWAYRFSGDCKELEEALAACEDGGRKDDALGEGK